MTWQGYERDVAITGQTIEEWLARLLLWFLIGLLGPITLDRSRQCCWVRCSDDPRARARRGGAPSSR
jgi:hypothetical protein